MEERSGGAEMPAGALRKLPLPSWAAPDAPRLAGAAGRVGLRSEAQEAAQAARSRRLLQPRLASGSSFRPGTAK